MALATAAALTGCSADTSNQGQQTDQAETTPETSGDDAEQSASDALATSKPFSSAEQLRGLSDVQLNSVNMLNYLVVLVQQIYESTNSRLLLEEIYSELIDNVSPDAVDEETLNYIDDILENLQDYKMLAVKRERLQAIYERAQAQAANQAIPNPLGLLSAATADNLLTLASSVIYMAVDAATTYSSAMTQAETDYLQNGWELDDEESENLHSSRKQMFDYTVNIVNEYGLPGSLALTEASVDSYVEWQDAEAANRLRFFEKNSDTYCALGAYWLLLARSYQEQGDVQRCVKAVETYEEFTTGILRRDESYAKTLSLALAACNDAQDGSFAEHAEAWAAGILDNCSDDDWALRYYAAQVYVALAGQTGDLSYLARAYETALDNANELMPEQRSQNSAWLSPVEKLDDASGLIWADKEQKERESYNNMLDAERKVALAPICEPLVMNLELLRAIQVEHPDQVDGSSPEALITAAGQLFLVDGLDERYATPGEAATQDSSAVAYERSEVKLPATLVTTDAKLAVELAGESNSWTITDWALDRVERGTEGNVSTFVAVYKSEAAGNASYQEGDTVKLTIEPWPEKELPTVEVSFSVVGTKTQFLDNLAVWDDGLGFERA